MTSTPPDRRSHQANHNERGSISSPFFVLPLWFAFSESLRIAYQIDDDLKDFHSEDTRDDIKAARPSLLLALLCEDAPASLKQTLEAAWHNGTDPAVYADEIRQVAEMLGIEERARQLREKYRCKTLDALKEVKNINLKILLYRLTAKILGPES